MEDAIERMSCTGERGLNKRNSERERWRRVSDKLREESERFTMLGERGIPKTGGHK